MIEDLSDAKYCVRQIFVEPCSARYVGAPALVLGILPEGHAGAGLFSDSCAPDMHVGLSCEPYAYCGERTSTRRSFIVIMGSP
jgi:hypothetical protein